MFLSTAVFVAGDKQATITVKFQKIRTPPKIAVIILKFEQYGFKVIETCPKDAVQRNGKHCRPFRNSLIWVYTDCPDLSVRVCRIIVVDAQAS